MKPAAQLSSVAAVPAAVPARGRIFEFLCGCWIGLSFMKFGNPIIFDTMIAAPKNVAEFVLTPWPIFWGYLILASVAVSALPLLKVRFDRADWPMAVFAFWLFWQILSGGRAIDSRLSNATVVHFVSCGIALILGWWGLAARRGSRWFWIPVVIALFYVLYMGFDQHAGGLEATRKAFYEQANWRMYPKEYILKIESNRIFSTLVYPNALAGLILLIGPAALWQVWQLTVSWPRVLRGVVTGLTAYLSVACFYWTGSKGGWLIALIIAGVAALQSPIPRKWKVALISAGLVLGLTAFFLRFSAYFEKGATSVGARFGYWRAAVQIAREHPVLGSGPGTFSVLFKRLKPPEAEMAKLVHNDYLEQFSDSGMAGGVSYLVGMIAVLVKLARRSVQAGRLEQLLWLGLLGWSLQSFIEFGLYIPAIAWPVFLFIGVLWGAPQDGRRAPPHLPRAQRG